MRLRIVGLLVAFGALLAACGGGGKSALPSIAQPAASAATPGQQATKRMAVVLNIPPASKQSKARRPFYVSPNTQSIVFAVVPNGSGTPTPSELQVFPVTTPSPCATTSAGGESCTFNVTAPFGTDIFYVATFAVASPNPASTTVPLASFVSGAIVVASPAPGVAPTPLSFTLNGVVYSVAVTVPSPDPANTPNTQVLVAASPTSLPLGITPYDSSGAPILSDTFLAPIPLIVTPQGEGIGLTLTSSTPCSTSTGNLTPSPVVDVGCAADLPNVRIVYPGTIFADTSDHIVDTFSIAASQQVSPAPSPANVVLASNIQTSVLGSGTGYNAGYLQALPNNVIAYMLESNVLTTALYGTVDVSTGTASTPITLNGTTPKGFYTMSDGSIWVSDYANLALLCFPAGATTATNTISLSSLMAYGPSDVTFDGTNIWATGSSSSSDTVAYAPITGTCSTGTLLNGTLTGDIYADSDLLMAPQSGGGVLINGVGTGGAWTVSSSGTITELNPGFTPGFAFGGGVGIDGTGVGYMLFNNESNGVIMSLPSGGTTLNQLVTVPLSQYHGLAAFGPNGGAADRIGYADDSNDVLGVVEGPNSATPVTILTTLGNMGFDAPGQAVAISTKGAGFVLYYDHTSSAVTLARTEFTSTWSVPVTTLALSNILSIDERGDSGPFTVSVVGTAPSCLGTISALANTDHDFRIPDTSGTSTCVVTLKVSDKNGRSQTVTVTAQPNAG